MCLIGVSTIFMCMYCTYLTVAKRGKIQIFHLLKKKTKLVTASLIPSWAVRYERQDRNKNKKEEVPRESISDFFFVWSV